MTVYHQFGKETEQQALDWFLKHKPCSLLARNYRCRWGEIDLVFEEQIEGGETELVFVEVRARDPEGWLTGIESVDPRKQARLEKTAQHFLAKYRGRASQMRMDVLSWDGTDWEYLPHVWVT